MSRDALVYAASLLPHLRRDDHLVDVGCGSGELSLDLAAHVGHITGFDIDEAEVESARQRAHQLGIGNADFRRGDAYALGIPDDHADAVFAHSVLEALDRPAAGLAEMKRVLKPGGVLGVASVDYAGLLLAGPHINVVRRFYDIRERLWQGEGADPYRGRLLRGLLLGAGLVEVVATTMYISYGTPAAVKEFGSGRAEDCVDEWYVSSALRQGLATAADLAAMGRAWREWAESPMSYAAFAWCQAIGFKA